MSGVMCAVCDARFSGRSDAIYCSSACRQKAHRARAARRVAAMAERLALSTRQVTVRSMTPFPAHRVREGIQRSRELCASAAEQRQRAVTLQQQNRARRLADAATAVSSFSRAQ